MARLVDEMSIRQVVIAIDNAQGREIRRILDICSAIPVKAQIVPSLNEIAHGRVSISRIRDVQIEDLLGREPVQLDDENLHNFLTGKTVMVTGRAVRSDPSLYVRSSTTILRRSSLSNVPNSFFSRSDVSLRLILLRSLVSC
jgi:hypothetical protein